MEMQNVCCASGGEEIATGFESGMSPVALDGREGYLPCLRTRKNVPVSGKGLGVHV